MSSIVLFDGQSCCGPATDRGEAARAVARFVADADWLAARGVDVRRVTISSDPGLFARTPVVADLLMSKGMAGLPALMVDGDLKISGRYPTRDELAQWCALGAAGIQATPALAPVVDVPAAGGQGCCRPAPVQVAFSGGCCAPASPLVPMTSDEAR